MTGFRTNYNDGDWYRVKVSRIGANATLFVQSMTKESHVETKTEYIGLIALPDGITVVLGASSGERYEIF